MFWVHNDEEVKEADDNFSSSRFFQEHTDGTPNMLVSFCLHVLCCYWPFLRRSRAVLASVFGIANVFGLLLTCSSPLGVYTACRTLNRWSVVDIEAHLDRLTLISGLEPSKSQSPAGSTFYSVSRSSPTSPPSIASLSDASRNVDMINGSGDLNTVNTDALRSNSANNGASIPWKPNRETLRSVTFPILRKLIEQFNLFDGGQQLELRMTVLVSHRWEGLPSEHTWRGASLLHRLNSSDAKAASAPEAVNEAPISVHNSQAPGQVISLSKDEKKRLERELFLELYDVWAFGEYMPEIPTAPIFIDLIAAERHNPTVKHVDWTNDRKKIEAEGTEGANEVVLMDARGRIAEGLSSNFLAIVRKEPQFLLSSDQVTRDMSGTASWDDAEVVVMTAPDHAVLAGTIRHLMLQCAAENNIPVVFDFPTKAQLENGQWLSCAIMSTSRLLLPVTQVNVLDVPSSNPSPHASPKDTSNTSTQRPSLSTSVELLPPLPAKLKFNSSHTIAQSYRFPSEHALLDRLVAAIRAKMKESSVYLKT